MAEIHRHRWEVWEALEPYDEWVHGATLRDEDTPSDTLGPHSSDPPPEGEEGRGDSSTGAQQGWSLAALCFALCAQPAFAAAQAAGAFAGGQDSTAGISAERDER